MDLYIPCSPPRDSGVATLFTSPLEDAEPASCNKDAQADEDGLLSNGNRTAIRTPKRTWMVSNGNRTAIRATRQTSNGNFDTDTHETVDADFVQRQPDCDKANMRRSARIQAKQAASRSSGLPQRQGKLHPKEILKEEMPKSDLISNIIPQININCICLSFQ